MKLITFTQHGHPQVGWLQDDGQTVRVIALDGLGALQDIVAAGDAALDRIRAAADQFATVPLAEITLLPPLPNPSAIFCVGLNYAAHEREAPISGTDYPTIFLRLARNQIADGAAMITPDVSPTLDWEGELVAIIGKPGRHIAAKDAMDHVFGWSIYNEASVRAYQHHSTQISMGKNFEGTGAFGPCIVTADRFGSPYAHSIETRLNGEIVQSSSIDLMTHRIEDVIAYLSTATTLRAGDILCTGTPAGVGAARKPPRFLKPGETIAVTIDGIGTLTNPVQAEQQDRT